MFSPLENFLTNFSFLTLFLSMLIYWIEISNFTFISTKRPNKNEKDLVGSLFSFSGALSQNININSSGTSTGAPTNPNPLSDARMLSENDKNIGQFTVLTANLSIFILLILRWKESGHFPLSNLYESLMFLSWTLTTIHLFLEFNLLKNMGPWTFSFLLDRDIRSREPKMVIASRNNIFMAKLLGSITTPSALFTNAFATFSLPKEMQEASPLVPALQSNWLMMHVTVMILSYGALICGSLLAIAFLVITSGKEMSLESGERFYPEGYKETETETDKTNIIGNREKLQEEKKPIFPGVSMSPPKPRNKNLLKLAQTFDNLSYRILGIGFPLLTIGILSGAVWANEAWGSYWSWDPKETWALLTWLVFAIYLHTRLNKGWQGKKPALIASLGFVSVWVCYLGVNLLGEGLHSYGWFNN